MIFCDGIRINPRAPVAQKIEDQRWLTANSANSRYLFYKTMWLKVGWGVIEARFKKNRVLHLGNVTFQMSKNHLIRNFPRNGRLRVNLLTGLGRIVGKNRSLKSPCSDQQTRCIKNIFGGVMIWHKIRYLKSDCRMWAGFLWCVNRLNVLSITRNIVNIHVRIFALCFIITKTGPFFTFELCISKTT